MYPKTATSAGAIILRAMDGQVKIALAHRLRATRIWVLPKGHVEPGETLRQAAIREVREETGLIRIQLLNYLGKLERTIPREGNIIQKTIHYYLAYALPTEPAEQPTDAGFAAPGWFTPTAALALLPYEQEQVFLKEHLGELFG
ncbi:MAG TPA: NUDIX domain-containing protein [Ktedonobacteraceae bacterium]|jgi:8-oxo-dGTP pyrophosphatase MutT (NUDIX family)